MRLLFGRSVRVGGRQPRHSTGLPFNWPSRSVARPPFTRPPSPAARPRRRASASRFDDRGPRRAEASRRGAAPNRFRYRAHLKDWQKGRFLMRPVVFVCVLVAACAIFAAPAAAQSGLEWSA